MGSIAPVISYLKGGFTALRDPVNLYRDVDGVKCNMLILSWLCKRGVLKTDTPLSRNRLYFNILQFTLNEIGSGAGTTAAAAAGFAGGGTAAEHSVTKEVRSGEIGFCTRSDFIQGTLCINRP